GAELLDRVDAAQQLDHEVVPQVVAARPVFQRAAQVKARYRPGDRKQGDDRQQNSGEFRRHRGDEPNEQQSEGQVDAQLHLLPGIEGAQRLDTVESMKLDARAVRLECLEIALENMLDAGAVQNVLYPRAAPRRQVAAQEV